MMKLSDATTLRPPYEHRRYTLSYAVAHGTWRIHDQHRDELVVCTVPTFDRALAVLALLRAGEGSVD